LRRFLLYNCRMNPGVSDTRPEVDELQRKLMRAASPARKLELVGQMNDAVLLLAKSGLKTRYPNEPPEKLRRRLADLVLGPQLAAKVYGRLESE